ncbi:hypothetical protein SASPL_135518 [Salvia splendens]|uniref:Gnk2-homologous domain-containing protein n=1 Tax=Salvia splendens TaxID=180675 RepID=A0A8X8ZFS6_SALSN|nr:plasmodesmata-located protein 7-like [Salvia splendens]KAG6403301.1 hypothetical protein SASPL_135518 [Salvia splendens]
MAKYVGQFASLLPFQFLLMIVADSAADSFLYGWCSHINYTPNSPYESNLNSLITSHVNSATYSSYNKSTITGSSPDDVVYGLYQCRSDLSMADCATCVARAVTRLGPMCPLACGGSVQLEGFFVKYDNASLIGAEDKSAAMKKCGPSDGDDVDQIGRRDAVLAAMSGGSGGPYRVGGAEGVSGVAQCVGELIAAQCQDCAAEAIRRCVW